ncbi:hypothetical protein B296_00056862 [Ensete ventricosum]|uniref:Uncharacterized protein n=1 Tax=Ensete ventricosum TaxID=4639 RepID=A0A426XHR0_ENSVE|nr:hypothetical protein B296_00056862 [Ensete ventricosum]
MRFRGAKSPFPLIWRKISVRVELRGVVGGRERLKSSPSILLLDGPEVGPRGCFVQGRLCSSRFSMIKVSAVMKWFALCIISGTVVGVLPRPPLVGRGPLGLRLGRGRCLGKLKNMGDDSLYHPRQDLYLMGQPEEGLRDNYLWRGETQRGEPGIGEQPSVSVGSQSRLSPICESRMGG